MESDIYPKGIEVSNSDQVLQIEWSDGHHSEDSLFGLRKNCPCVDCRGQRGT
ncbi:MAG: gamma-butyrobetaine hydroxylase-like domain-containing protein [Fodinibius sp.]|nr:gamma-butyrobetaine hydroxylase-like domain-containing protein [Fodinibius sp.]